MAHFQMSMVWMLSTKCSVRACVSVSLKARLLAAARDDTVDSARARVWSRPKPRRRAYSGGS